DRAARERVARRMAGPSTDSGWGRVSVADGLPTVPPAGGKESRKLLVPAPWRWHNTGAPARPVAFSVEVAMWRFLCAVAVLPVAFLVSVQAGGPAPAKAPLPADLVAPDTKATAAAGVCFLEGPAVDAQGHGLFSRIARHPHP